MKKLTYLVSLFLIIASCNGKNNTSQSNPSSMEENTNKQAKALCDCFKDKVSLDGELSEIQKKFETLSEKETQGISECILKVGKSVEDDLEKLKEKKDKKTYTKNLIKSIVDCDCMDKLMDHIPFEAYGKLLDQAKDEMKEASRKSEDISEMEDFYPEVESSDYK